MRAMIIVMLAVLLSGCVIKEDETGCVIVSSVASSEDGTYYYLLATDTAALTCGEWVSTNLYPVGAKLKLVAVTEPATEGAK